MTTTERDSVRRLTRIRTTPGACLLAALTLVSLPAFANAQARPRTTTTPQATTTATDLSNILEATARQVGPSIVQIFATTYSPGDAVVPRPSDLVTTQRGSGSGVIVDADGFILTNAHVVRGALRLRVELPLPANGQSILAGRSKTVTAEVVGLDLETDLAVLKVPEKNLPVLVLGDSDQLRAGQIVLAIGSPLGLNNSVSMGVVSAAARQLSPDSPMVYVQTDASINPGSSGGPLLDLAGHVVGINTMIASQAGGSEGLGFAAPSNIVRAVFDQIKKYGRVRRGEIGIRPQTLTATLAAGLHLSRDSGVILADVIPSSPAARAGLQPGDIVLAVDGKPMENGRQLTVTLYRHVVGDVVNLDVVRGDQTMKFPVAMAERPDAMDGLSDAVDPRENLVSRLGILGIDLDRDLAAKIGVVRVRNGVIVASTVAGAIDAREGGLALGDVIYAINKQPIARLGDLRKMIDSFKSGDAVVLQLERRGELLFLSFTVE